MTNFKVLVTFLVTIFVSASVHGTDQASAAAECEGSLSRIITNNLFQTKRHIDEIMNLMGPRFATKLQSLGGSGHVLDAGAGEAGFEYELFDASAYVQLYDDATIGNRYGFGGIKNKKAGGQRLSPEEKVLDSFFSRHRKLIKRTKNKDYDWEISLDHIPNVTAVSAVVEGSMPLASDRHKGKFSFLKGRFFEEISDSELIRKYGPVDLIMDMYGVFSYSTSPSEVLQKYVNVMADDGEAHIFVGRTYSDSNLNKSLVMLKEGRQISLVQWVKSIKGLDVEVVASDLFYNGPTQVMIIKKKKKSVLIPQIQLVDLITENHYGELFPPLRYLKEL